MLLGHLPEFTRDPLGFLTAVARAQGPVTRLRFGRTPALLLGDPALIEDVLVAKRNDFVKAPALRAQHRLLGDGLLTNEGDSWLRQRRLAQPAFHRERVAGYGDVVVRAVGRMLDAWPAGEVRDVQSEARALMTGVAAETLFGADVDATQSARIGRAVELAMDRFAGRRGAARWAPEWLPVASHRRYHEAVREFDTIIAEVLRARRGRSDCSDRSDLLTMLLEARDEDGTGMSDRQLRDEVVTLLVGGFDTPSLAVAWAWQLLAQHPDAAAALAAEVDAAVGDRPPTAVDVPRLHYVEAVVKESMRLYPPAWLLSRQAVRDTEIGGHLVRRGAVVLMSQWVMHRDPRYFDAPNEFRPSRWTAEGAERLPRFAYFPFGGGPRLCIGAAFAMMESVLVLAAAAQRLRFETVGPPAEPWPTMTLRPRGGVLARAVRR